MTASHYAKNKYIPHYRDILPDKNYLYSTILTIQKQEKKLLAVGLLSFKETFEMQYFTLLHYFSASLTVWHSRVCL